MRHFSGGATICLLLVMSACAPVERPAPVAEPSADSFQQFYTNAARQPGNRVYRIDSSATLLLAHVSRAGRLAKLGHDHVIASRDLSGFLLINADRGVCRGDFMLPVARLTVDESELRQRLALDTQPSGTDIDATRANMLNHVLAAERFPVIRAAVTDCDPQRGDFHLQVDMHGVQQTLRLNAGQFELTQRGFGINGRFTLRQSDFGIAVFSALGGLLSVADEVELHYRISGERLLN